MLERKIDPDVVTFSVLINAFVKEGNFFMAEELYDDMIRVGVYPDTVTYNSIIDGFCKHNRLDEAKHMFGLMLQMTALLTFSPTIVLFAVSVK